MALYVVSYDLRKRKDYPKLWDEMGRLGGFKPLESVYLLDLSDTDPQGLKDHLRTFIDDDDRLIVT